MTVEVDPEADSSDPRAAGRSGGRMVLGISARDRPGLLHDISQGLNRLQVQLLHCEVRPAQMLPAASSTRNSTLVY